MQALTLFKRKKGRIESIHDPIIAKQLYSMGITPGNDIEIIRKGPFGQSFYVLIGSDFRVALRKEEVNCIYVV